MVECQLPKLDVAGSTPVSRSNFFNNLQAPTHQVGSNWLHSHHSEGWFELVYRFTAALKRSSRIDVFVYIDGVPHLLGPDLRINVQLL